jgi:hypothetical protein
MNNSFLTAAASYYGIQPNAADWQNENGTLVLTFQYTPSVQDIEGIMSRMRTLKESQPKQTEPEQPMVITWDEAVALYGPSFDSLMPDAKSKWGSRQRYIQRMVESACEGSHIVTMASEPKTIDRKVVHVNVPEQESPDIPEARWIPKSELSATVLRMASDERHMPAIVDGELGIVPCALIQLDMLTPEQRTRYA